nr:unnamed protein product [Callosobruchus chinensis]
MLLLLVALTTIGFGLYGFLKYRYSYWKRKGIKQTGTSWILGDNLRQMLMQEHFADMIKRLHDMHVSDRYVGGYQMMIPTLLVNDLDLIKTICVKDFDHFSNHRTFVPEDVDPLFGKNLFALKDQRWREMRAILSPSFTSSKMRGMFTLMSDCAEKWVDFFMNKNQDVIELDMKDSLTRYTNDVIATCAFGIEVDSLNNPDNNFYVMGRKATDLTSLRRKLKLMGYLIIPWLYKLLKVTFLEDDVKEFFYNLVDDTIRVREEKGIVRPDMIHLMMEAKKGKASKTEGDEKVMDTGFATAQESNISRATTTPWLIILLAFTDRVCNKPYTIQPTKPGEKPVQLSVGQNIIVPIYGLHHYYKYWPHPERFDPERFSDENKDKILPYTYLPFGVGPRNCIGSRFALLELKALFFHMLSRFELVPTDKTQIPLKLCKTSINPMAEMGFWMGLKKLEN